MYGAKPPRVFFYTKPVDFRRQIDGLSRIIQETCRMDPFTGAAYVFRPKRGDRIKIIVWDGTGTIMVYKRLHDGAFRWPSVEDGVLKLSPAQFAALFDGLEWRNIYSRRVQRPKKAG